MLNQVGPDMIVTRYAWNVEVPSLHWKWNKHAFRGWSALTCPPWNLDQQLSIEAWETEYNGSSSGLFPHPPMPSELINQEPADLFQDLASIEIVAMLNEAFCELHHKPYCPASEELRRECGKTLVLSLLDQLTPAAPKDRKAAACGNSPQSMEEFKTCIGNPFWVPL
ncbi:hypothetical protein WJX82_003840 [Trebouxia sp. C0006]